MTEMLDAIKTARMNNLKIIISQRSGETTDSFIADLAYAVGAFGVKIGAPVRGERTAKYNRLIKIEKDYAPKVQPSAPATPASVFTPASSQPTPAATNAPNPTAPAGGSTPPIPPTPHK